MRNKVILISIISIFTILLISLSSAVSYGNNDEKRAFYKFDSAIGSTLAKDQLGIYNGTLNAGATFNATGGITGFNNYTGSNGVTGNYISTGYTANSSDNDAFTLEFRIKTGTTAQQIMGDWDTNANAKGFNVEIVVNNIRVKVNDGSSTIINDFDFGCSAVTDNIWHHVAIVKYTNLTWLAYQDGAKCSNTVQGNISGASAGAFNILRGRNDGATTLNGGLDELVRWTRALTQAEIVSLNNSIDTGGISVALNSPANSAITSTIPINFSATATPDGATANTNITFNIWNASNTLVNQTTNIITGTVANISTILIRLTAGTYTWNAYGCGLIVDGSYSCVYATSNRSLTVGATLNNISINTSSYELQAESYIANLTIPITSNVTNVSFFYNNINYPVTYNLAGANLMLNSNLTIPSGTSGNKTFYWTLIYNNSFQQNITNSQVVSALTNITVATTCSAGLTSAFYFNAKDEATLSLINFNATYNLQYGFTNTTSKVASGSFSNVSAFNICINATNPTYTVGYGEVQYNIGGYTDRRFYIFSTTRANSTQVNNTLYGLPSSLATSFLVQVKNTDLTPLVNYYVALLRWYPDLNTYNIVEMGKTDDNGETVLRVKTEDVDYRIAVYTNAGVLVKLINPLRMVCLSSPCTYTILTSTTASYTSYQKVLSNLTFDPTLKKFTYIWNDPTQETSSMNLTVYKDTGTSSTVICSQQASGFTGVLTCDVSAYTGLLRAEVYRSASPQLIIASLIEEIKTTIIDLGGSSLGLFISAILFIFIALVGAYVSPILAIIFGIIALIPAVLIGSITFAIFIGIAVLGGIVYHFAKRT